jgi:hypothetical protein
MTQYPFMAVDDSKFITLRHQWALDRLCGEQLFFEAWAGLQEVSRRGSIGHWRPHWRAVDAHRTLEL